MKEELIGVAVHDIELKKKGDLLFFEFPILSHFQDQYGANYLFSPKDKNDRSSSQ